MDLANDRALYRFATAPLARPQRAVAPDYRVRQLGPSGLAVADFPAGHDQLTAPNTQWGYCIAPPYGLDVPLESGGCLAPYPLSSLPTSWPADSQSSTVTSR